MVVISSPEAVEECFTKNNDIVFANRDETIAGKLLFYDNGIIGLSSYGDNWRNLRRIAAIEMLNQNRLAMFTSIRQEEISLMNREIYEEWVESDVKKPVKVNLRSKLSDLTLNIMMRMIAGKRYYGKNVAQKEEAKQFQQVLKEMVSFRGDLNLEDYFPIFRFTDFRGLKKKMVIVMTKVDRLLQNIVDEHRKRKIESNTTQKKTFIDTLLSAQDTEPEFLTDRTIKALTLSLLGAGTETTSTTLEWAISLLLNHPEAMKKAITEIQKVVGEDRLLEETDLPKLNYLDNVVSETLRLYPVQPLLLPHRSSEDCEISGYHIPKDTVLVANMWKIQRDPELWDEPEKFKPERFDGGAGGEGFSFKMLPFGVGRRACPGTNLARRVIGLTLGSLIQSFEFEKLVAEEPVNMTESSGFTLSKETPLEAFFFSQTETNKQTAEPSSPLLTPKGKTKNMAEEAAMDHHQTTSQEATVETPVKSEVTSAEETDVVSSEDKKTAGTGNVSFSIWPPTQRTRDAIIARLVQTLSSTSVLSKRYGVVPQGHAEAEAKRIEDEAFTAANPATTSADDDGIEILQTYSKEISRRMIDFVKSRSGSAAPAAADAAPASNEETGPAAGVKEEGKEDEGPAQE
ncbi:OLC1v1016903C2 [Oldenlandia corymbosa var. corymbosa]|nr:OLC1v1016903C2 [Oldenlandia corymbosa var. corymbosa]